MLTQLIQFFFGGASVVTQQIWSVQAEDNTTWSAQTEDNSTWSVQTEDSTTWSEQ